MPLLWTLIIVVGISSILTSPCLAQLGSGQQEAASILNALPPDLLTKVRTLAKILEQSVADGKLTDEEIQQGLLSGRLGDRLKQLSPEAAQLLKEISDASRQGAGPGEESLIPLLGGLGLLGR